MSLTLPFFPKIGPAILVKTKYPVNAKRFNFLNHVCSNFYFQKSHVV